MKGYERIAVQVTNLLRAHPRGMTITDISRSLHLNRNSVAKYLEILVTSGQVEKQRIGRASSIYITPQPEQDVMVFLPESGQTLSGGRHGSTAYPYRKTGRFLSDLGLFPGGSARLNEGREPCDGHEKN